MDRINTAVRAGPPVNDLVTRAGNGDKQAWDTLVERPMRTSPASTCPSRCCSAGPSRRELLAAIGGSY